jgi:outer membrane protein insertion porin family
LAAAALAAAALSTYAQDLTRRNVSEIRIQGLERISESQVRAQIETTLGEPYNPRAVARDIRRIFELGHFTTAKVDAQEQPDGLVLTYIVEEKRFIEEIRIMGNRRLDDGDIREVISWREGGPFVPAAYEDERDAILQLYEEKRFPNAKVDIVVEELAPTQVRVTYMIDEGGRARISSIEFEGNEAVSERRLRQIMQTSSKLWFIGGKYDARQFEEDLKNILREYANHGRLEARIAETRFTYSDGGSDLHILIRIDEGPEYAAESVGIEGNFVYGEDEIRELLEVTEGDVHDAGQVERDAELIEKGYWDSGYVQARVEARVTIDRDKKTTHVVHAIAEDELRYVREVRITGNTETRDEVIRREILLTPGERFDGTLWRASERRIENTRYFDTYRFNLGDLSPESPYADLLVDVEEGKTGFFNFGVGYSTEEKLGGYVEVEMDNFDITDFPTFTGAGQQFNARLSIGDVRNEYSIGFTDPEFLGYPFAFGVDLFNERYEYTGGLDYTEEDTGGQLRLGKMLSTNVGTRVALRYEDSEISDLPFFINPVFARERGESTTISFVWGISRNTIDITRDPSSGAKHEVFTQFAGLGGDNHFYKIEHDSTWYIPLRENRRWIFSWRTREGFVSEYGDSEFVPIQDRFFAGGTSTVRGYDQNDIGPQVREYFFFGEEERIGGELRLVENVELKYKIDDRFRLYGFVDAGGVWRTTSDFDLGDMKYGAGLGVGVDVPRLGPVRLDYGVAINPDDDQGSGRWHFVTGFRW